MDPGPTRSQAERGDRFAARAWVLVTVVAIAITSVGIQDIASRVVDALELSGRGGEEQHASLQLAPRAGTGRFGAATTAASASPVVPGPGLRPEAPGEAPGAPAPPPTTSRDQWDEWTASSAVAPFNGTGSTTNWERTARAGWELQYLHPTDGSRPGYADNADTSLVSPWLRVPAGRDPLWLVAVADGFTEPSYDRLTVQWQGDSFGWSTIGRHDGGVQAATPLRFRLPDTLRTGDRILVRLRFTSDDGVSTFGDEVLGQNSGVTGIRLHEVLVERAALAPSPHVGTPTRRLVPSVDPEPRAVVALTGGGINPYHEQFRDDSPRAFAHPSTYLAGYPEDAVAVWLSLDAPTYHQAVERDRAVWAGLQRGELYWFPGTRIIAARAMEFRSCDPVCVLDREVDDDGPSGMAAGHGTSMASRVAARDFGACPTCLLAIGQGWGAQAIRWPAENARWIDLQIATWATNAAWTGNDYDGVPDAAARAAAVQPVFAPNVVTLGVNDGLASAPGVISVGVHDRGHVVATSAPGSRLVGPYCGNRHTAPRSLTGLADDGAGSTFAAATVGGRVAQVLLEVRQGVGDLDVGVREGAIVESGAQSPDEEVKRLTIEDFLDTLQRSASPRPSTDPRGPACAGGSSTVGSTGAPWSTVPDGPAVWAQVGYGVVDEAARGRAVEALLAGEREPARPLLDRWFDLRDRLGQARVEASRVTDR